MARQQTVFMVNCTGCGQKIEVVNPRLHQEPKRVYVLAPVGHMQSGGSSEYNQSIQVGCSCGQRQIVNFEY